MPEQPRNQKLAGDLNNGRQAGREAFSSRTGQGRRHLEGVKGHAPSLLRVRHRDASTLHLALQVRDELLRHLHLYPSADYRLQHDCIIVNFQGGVKTGSHIFT